LGAQKVSSHFFPFGLRFSSDSRFME
jgi:hypothetical protein